MSNGVKNSVQAFADNCPLDPVQVLRTMARRAGVAALAAQLGKSERLLYKKLDEEDDKTPTLREAVAITDLTGDESLLDAWCAHRGGVFVRLPRFESAQDDEVFEDFMRLVSEEGEFAKLLTLARADGVIEPHEFSGLADEAREISRALATLMAHLESQVRELKR